MMKLEIAKPCPMSLDDLVGDQRIRYCGRCRLNVYNLVVMKPREIEELVRKTEGRLCGRIYVREDRTATIRQCERGSFSAKVKVALALAGVLVVGIAGWMLRSQEPDRQLHHPWVRAVLDFVDPQPRPKPPPRFLVGELPAPPPPPAPQAPTPAGS